MAKYSLHHRASKRNLLGCLKFYFLFIALTFNCCAVKEGRITQRLINKIGNYSKKLSATRSKDERKVRHKNMEVVASSLMAKTQTKVYKTNANKLVDKNGIKRDSFTTIPESFPFKMISKRHYNNENIRYIPQFYPLSNMKYISQPIAMAIEIANKWKVQHYHIHKDLNQDPCMNGGVYALAHQDYICICPKEFRGKNCQDKNYCFSGPCMNDGVCKEISHGYKCLCMQGFMGSNCEEKNPCQPNPCKLGGSCVISDEDERFQCICNPGSKGKRCELVDKCKPNPCKNSGTCEEREEMSVCLCTSEYKGPTCEDERQCFQQPCLNGGTCLEHDDSFNCTCPAGFTGDICGEHVCDPSPCMHEGKCTVESGHFKCHCPPLYKGDFCEIPNPCHVRPCLNGALCIDSFSGYHSSPTNWNRGSLHYLCICQPGFSGFNCEVNVCKKCHSFAKCVNKTCICNPGYKGDGFHCEQEEGLCDSNPCKNGASCKENVQGGYDCLCIDFFSGPKCEEKNPCIPSPCHNESECVTLQNADYRCVCDSSRNSGKNCDISNKSGCSPNSCLNGGTCYVEENMRRCLCKKPYLGSRCEQDPTIIDKSFKNNICHPNPCQNGGVCVAVTSGYDCECSDQFTGAQCEVDKCSKCDIRGAHCIAGECRCMKGYMGNGFHCVKGVE